jgi:hypothetical protein
MSHRPKVVNGVQHGRRCCCPICDPDNLLTAAMVKAYRERPAPIVRPTTGDVRRALRARPAHSEAHHDDDTTKFRQLLREGLSAAEAQQRIETERNATHEHD